MVEPIIEHIDPRGRRTVRSYAPFRQGIRFREMVLAGGRTPYLVLDPEAGSAGRRPEPGPADRPGAAPTRPTR